MAEASRCRAPPALEPALELDLPALELALELEAPPALVLALELGLALPTSNESDSVRMTLDPPQLLAQPCRAVEAPPLPQPRLLQADP